MKFASNAIGQRHLAGFWENVFQVAHDFVDGDLDLIFVLNRHIFHVVQSHFFEAKQLTSLVLHHRRTITRVVDLIQNARAEFQVF